MPNGFKELATKITSAPTRMAILIWGSAGLGKTTFACTAPGKKLILNVDHDGYIAVQHRTDIIIADVSDLSFSDFIKDYGNDDPGNLSGYLKSNPEIDTVIVDSTTSIFYRCLQQAIHKQVGKSAIFTPTLEAPGLSAYGARTAFMIQILSGILRVTGQFNKHVIFLSHEDTPDKNKDGEIINISMSLSDGAINQTSFRLSEIWYMGLLGQDRSIAIRPTRLRKPMKTRIFTASQDAEFRLNYNADVSDEEQPDQTIAGWYDKWRLNGYKKLPVPGKVLKTRK